jgi:hypothetical protein
MKDIPTFRGMTQEQIQYTLDLQDELIASYREHTTTLKESNARLEQSCLIWKAINDFEDSLYYKILYFWPFVPKFVGVFTRKINGLRENEGLAKALREIGKEMEAW